MASIQDALKEYGPLAWGTIGILSALSIAWVFVMISWAQKIKVRAKYDDLLLLRIT